MKLLDIFRVVNMYVLVFSLLFILQKYTVGFIPHLKEIILFNNFYFYELLFTANAILFIKLFVKVGIPRSS